MSELEAVEALHRAAQARLGLAVALLTRDGFGSVNGTRAVSSGAGWLRSTLDAIMFARELSVALAQAYYMYARAIETGYTLGAPLDGRPATMAGLRDAFISRALSIAQLGEDLDASEFHSLYTPDVGEGALSQVDIMPLMQQLLDSIDESTDSRPVQVEEFQWLSAAKDTATLQRIRDELTKQVLDPLANEVGKGLRRDGDPKKAIRSVEAATEGAAKTGAGWADKLALSPGRELIENAGLRDRRALMFARGLGPNPCHFCAALASRGFVYKSRQSASSTMRDGGMRAYHPNCHCYPIARWVSTSPLPAMNQYFADNWKQVTANYSGRNGKLGAWRKWLNDLKRAGKFPPPNTVNSQEEPRG